MANWGDLSGGPLAGLIIGVTIAAIIVCSAIVVLHKRHERAKRQGYSAATTTTRPTAPQSTNPRYANAPLSIPDRIAQSFAQRAEKKTSPDEKAHATASTGELDSTTRTPDPFAELQGRVLRPDVELNPDQHPVTITPELPNHERRAPVTEMEASGQWAVPTQELAGPPVARPTELPSREPHPAFASELSSYSPRHDDSATMETLAERQARIQERRQRLMELEQLDQEEEEIKRKMGRLQGQSSRG